MAKSAGEQVDQVEDLWLQPDRFAVTQKQVPGRIEFERAKAQGHVLRKHRVSRSGKSRAIGWVRIRVFSRVSEGLLQAAPHGWGQAGDTKRKDRKMTHQDPIRRLPGGAIDTRFYIERGMVCRSRIAHSMLAAAGRRLAALFSSRTRRALDFAEVPAE